MHWDSTASLYIEIAGGAEMTELRLDGEEVGLTARRPAFVAAAEMPARHVIGAGIRPHASFKWRSVPEAPPRDLRVVYLS